MSITANDLINFSIDLIIEPSTPSSSQKERTSRLSFQSVDGDGETSQLENANLTLASKEDVMNALRAQLDAKESELETLYTDNRTLQEQLSLVDDLKSQVQFLKQYEEDFRKEKETTANLQAQIETLDLARKSDMEHLEQQQKLVEELRSQIDFLGDEKRVKDEEMEALDEKIRTLDTQVQAGKDIEEKLQQQLSDLQGEHEKVLSQLRSQEEVSVENVQLRNQLDEAVTKNQSLEGTITFLNEKLELLAEESRKLQEDIQTLDMTNKLRVEELECQLNEDTSKNHSLEGENSLLTQKLEQLADDSQKLQEQIQTFDATGKSCLEELKQEKKLVEELTSQIGLLVDEKTTRDEEMKALEENSIVLQQQLTDLHGENEKILTQLQEQEEMAAELILLRQQLDEAELKNRESDEENCLLTQKLEQLMQDTSKLQALNETLDLTVKSHLEQLEQEKKLVEDLRSQIEVLEDEKKTKDEELEFLSEKIKTLDDQILAGKEMEEKSLVLQQQLTDLQSEHEKILTQLQSQEVMSAELVQIRHELDEAVSENRCLEEANSLLTQKLEQMTENSTKLEIQIETLDITVKSYLEELEQEKKLAEDLKSQIEVLEDEKKTKDEELEFLSEKIKTLDDQILAGKEVEEKSLVLQQQLTDLRSEHEKILTQVQKQEEMAAELILLRQQLDDAELKNRESDEENCLLTQKLEQLMQDTSKLQALNETLDLTVKSHLEQLEQEKKLVEDLRSQMEFLTDEKRTRDDEVEALNEKIRTLDGQVEFLNDEKKARDEEFFALEEKIRTLDEQVQVGKDIEEQNVVLQQQLTELQGEHEKVLAQIRSEDDLTAEMAQLRIQLDEAISKNRNLEEENSLLTNKIEQITEESRKVDQMESQLRNLEAEKKNISQKMDFALKQAKKWEKSVQELHNEKERMAAELNEIRELNDKQARDIMDYLEQCRNVRSELKQEKNKVDSMTQQWRYYRNTHKQTEKLKKVMADEIDEFLSEPNKSLEEIKNFVDKIKRKFSGEESEDEEGDENENQQFVRSNRQPLSNHFNN